MLLTRIITNSGLYSELFYCSSDSQLNSILSYSFIDSVNPHLVNKKVNTTQMVKEMNANKLQQVHVWHKKQHTL